MDFRTLLLNIHENLPWAIFVNLVIGFSSYFAGFVDRSGLIVGLIIGIVIFCFAGWQGFVLLFVFFLAGSVGSRFGMRKKAAMGIAQAKEGRRSSIHVLANCSVGMVAAGYMALFEAGAPLAASAAFTASFATALADTLGTELGQIYGKRPVLIPGFKRVRVGTKGAVSLEGTVFGALGVIIYSGLGLILSLPPEALAAVIVAFAAIFGFLSESVLRQALTGRMKITGNFLNLANTATGAIVAALIVMLIY